MCQGRGYFYTLLGGYLTYKTLFEQKTTGNEGCRANMYFKRMNFQIMQRK